MSQVPVWFERKFEFAFPVEQYPNVCVRLRGAPARLEELTGKATLEALVRKSSGKWSAQEHAGHLLDMEALWLTRVQDFFQGNSQDTLTVAELTNRKTEEAHHNARALSEILANF